MSLCYDRHRNAVGEVGMRRVCPAVYVYVGVFVGSQCHRSIVSVHDEIRGCDCGYGAKQSGPVGWLIQEHNWAYFGFGLAEDGRGDDVNRVQATVSGKLEIR